MEIEYKCGTHPRIAENTSNGVIDYALDSDICCMYIKEDKSRAGENALLIDGARLSNDNGIVVYIKRLCINQNVFTTSTNTLQLSRTLGVGCHWRRWSYAIQSATTDQSKVAVVSRTLAIGCLF